MNNCNKYKKKYFPYLKIILLFFAFSILINFSILIYGQSNLPSIEKFSKLNEKKKETLILEIIKNYPDNYSIYKYIILTDKAKDYFINLKENLLNKLKDKDLNKEQIVKYYKNLTFTCFFLNESENFIIYYNKIVKFLSPENYNFLNSIYLIFSSIEGTEDYKKGVENFIPYLEKINGLSQYILKFSNNNELINIIVDYYKKYISSIYNNNKLFKKEKEKNLKFVENLLPVVKRPDTLANLISILSIFDSQLLKQTLNNYLSSQFNDVKLESIKALFRYYKISEIDFNIFYGYLENGDLQFRNDLYNILKKIKNVNVIKIFSTFYFKEPDFIKKKILAYLMDQDGIEVIDTYINFLLNEKNDIFKNDIKNYIVLYLSNKDNLTYNLHFIEQIVDKKIYETLFLKKAIKFLNSDSETLKSHVLDYFSLYYIPSYLNDVIFKYIFFEVNYDLTYKAYSLLVKWKQNDYITLIFKNISKNIIKSKNEIEKLKKLRGKKKEIEKITNNLNHNFEILNICLYIKNISPNIEIINSIYSIRNAILENKDFDLNLLSNFLSYISNSNDLSYIKKIIEISDFFKFKKILDYYLTFNDEVVEFDLKIIDKDPDQLYIYNLIKLLSRDKKISLNVANTLLKYEVDEYINKLFILADFESLNYLNSLYYISTHIDISNYFSEFKIVLDRHFNDDYYNVINNIFTYYIIKEDYDKKQWLIDFLYSYKTKALPIYFSFIHALVNKNDIKTLVLVINKLGDLKSAQSIPILSELLNNKSISVQIKSIEALSKIAALDVLNDLMNWGEKNTNNVSAQIYIFKTFEKVWINRCYDYLKIFVNGPNETLKEKALFLLSLHPLKNNIEFYLKNLDKENILDYFYQFYNKSNNELKNYVLNRLKTEVKDFFEILVNGIVQKKISFKDKNLILFLNPYIDKNKDFLSNLYFNVSDKKLLIPILSLAKDDELFNYVYESVKLDYTLSKYIIWGFLNTDYKKVKLSSKIVLKNLDLINYSEINWFLDYLYKNKKYENINSIVISDPLIYKIFNKKYIFKLLNVNNYKLVLNLLILLRNYDLNEEDFKILISLNPNYIFLFKKNVKLSKYDKFILFKDLIKHYNKLSSAKKIYIFDNYLTYIDKQSFENIILLYVSEKDKNVYKYIEDIILNVLNSYPDEINRFFNIYLIKNDVSKNNINSLSLNFLLKINNINAAKLLLEKDIKNISSYRIISLINNNQISNSLLYYLYKVYPDAFMWILKAGNLTNYKIQDEFLIELLKDFINVSSQSIVKNVKNFDSNFNNNNNNNSENNDNNNNNNSSKSISKNSFNSNSKEDNKLFEDKITSIKLLINSFNFNGNEFTIAKEIIKLKNDIISKIFIDYIISLIEKKSFIKNLDSSLDNNKLLLSLSELYLNIDDPVIQMEVINKINNNNLLSKYFVEYIFYLVKTYLNNSNNDKFKDKLNSIYILFNLKNIKFDDLNIDKKLLYKFLNIYFINLFEEQDIWINNNIKNIEIIKNNLELLNNIINPIFDNIDPYKYFTYLKTFKDNYYYSSLGKSKSYISNKLIFKTLYLIEPDLLKYNEIIGLNKSTFLDYSEFNKNQLAYLIKRKNLYVLRYLVVSKKNTLDKTLLILNKIEEKIAFLNLLGKDIIYAKSSFKLLKIYSNIIYKYKSYFYNSIIMNFNDFDNSEKIESTYFVLKNYKKLNYHFLKTKIEFNNFVLFLLQNSVFYNPELVIKIMEKGDFEFYKFIKVIFDDKLQSRFKIYYRSDWENLKLNYNIEELPINFIRLKYLSYFLKKYKAPELIGKYLLPYIKDNDWLSQKMFDKIINEKIKGLEKYLYRYYSGKKWKKYIEKYKNLKN